MHKRYAIFNLRFSLQFRVIDPKKLIVTDIRSKYCFLISNFLFLLTELIMSDTRTSWYIKLKFCLKKHYICLQYFLYGPLFLSKKVFIFLCLVAKKLIMTNMKTKRLIYTAVFLWSNHSIFLKLFGFSGYYISDQIFSRILDIWIHIRQDTGYKNRPDMRSNLWYLYKMVAQNMLRTYKVK